MVLALAKRCLYSILAKANEEILSFFPPAKAGGN